MAWLLGVRVLAGEFCFAADDRIDSKDRAKKCGGAPWRGKTRRKLNRGNDLMLSRRPTDDASSPSGVYWRRDAAAGAYRIDSTYSSLDEEDTSPVAKMECRSRNCDKCGPSWVL
jgi:hypothetical protein